jgi:hypothetical protein
MVLCAVPADIRSLRYDAFKHVYAATVFMLYFDIGVLTKKIKHFGGRFHPFAVQIFVIYHAFKCVMPVKTLFQS